MCENTQTKLTFVIFVHRFGPTQPQELLGDRPHTHFFTRVPSTGTLLSNSASSILPSSPFTFSDPASYPTPTPISPIATTGYPITPSSDETADDEAPDTRLASGNTETNDVRLLPSAKCLLSLEVHRSLLALWAAVINSNNAAFQDRPLFPPPSYAYATPSRTPSPPTPLVPARRTPNRACA